MIVGGRSRSAIMMDELSRTCAQSMDTEHYIQGLFEAVSKIAGSEEYSIPFWAALLWLLLLLNRRASLKLIWKKLHIFQDTNLESEAFKKVDVPLQALLLLLAFFPFLKLLPGRLDHTLTPLVTCVTAFLALHVFVSALDLAVFGWYFTRSKEANIPSILRVVVLSTIYIGVGLLLLNATLGINVMPLLATSTLITAVFGFALQDTLKNLFAGLTMSFEKRFKQGDWIMIGTDPATATLGQVMEIGWRSTKVKLREDDFAVIPNTQCTASQLVNLSSPRSTHLLSVDFPAKFDTDIEELRKTLLKTVNGISGVVKEPPAEVLAVGIKPEYLMLKVRFWIEDLEKRDTIQSEVVERTFKRLTEDQALPPVPAK